MSNHEEIIDSISNPGAERYILAYIFKYPDAIYDIGARLKEDDFCVLANKIIFSTMLMVAGRAVIDPQVIISSCIDNNLLNKVGGEEYIAHLMLTSVNPSNVDYYIDLLRSLSVRRRVYKEALNIMNDAVSDDESDIDTFLGKQQQRLLDISLGVEDIDKVVNLGDNVDEWLEQRALINDEVPGIPTGFPLFDKDIGGLYKTRLYVIQAYSKVGKSALMTNWALHISVLAKNKVPVLYIDTEMPTEEVRSRALASISGVPEKNIVNGTYVRSDESIDAVRRARNLIKDGLFYHVYLPVFTPDQIYNLARKYKMKYGIKVLFFDYLKIPDSKELRSVNINEYQQLGFLASMLKNSIAGELDIPVVTGAQSNREGQLADSIRILRYCSHILHLRNKTEAEIARDGTDLGNQLLEMTYSRHGGEDYKVWIDYNRPIIKMNELCRADTSSSSPW